MWLFIIFILDTVRQMQCRVNGRQQKITFFTPQFIARYLLDIADKYLNDFVLFRELFIWSCTVITVTKLENNLLKGQTKNKDDVFSITCMMQDKYKNVGIEKLYKENVGYVEGFPLEIWPGISEYEKQYLV